MGLLVICLMLPYSSHRTIRTMMVISTKMNLMINGFKLGPKYRSLKLTLEAPMASYPLWNFLQLCLSQTTSILEATSVPDEKLSPFSPYNGRTLGRPLDIEIEICDNHLFRAIY